jgi:Ca-activated chloride channel family protein
VREQEALPRLWASRKIGFLLSEIRLRGASKELVDEVVALATRYGIATPYTSFFVPEPGRPVLPGSPPATPAPLSAAGRAQAADALQQAASAAPDYGATAVQNSEATNQLKNATNAPAEPSETVRVAGDKTFILSGGAWNETSTGQEPPTERIQIEFASDAYFALLDQYPQIARYLAVGPHLILNLSGTWYEITPA